MVKRNSVHRKMLTCIAMLAVSLLAGDAKETSHLKDDPHARKALEEIFQQTDRELKNKTGSFSSQAMRLYNFIKRYPNTLSAATAMLKFGYLFEDRWNHGMLTTKEEIEAVKFDNRTRTEVEEQYFAELKSSQSWHSVWVKLNLCYEYNQSTAYTYEDGVKKTVNCLKNLMPAIRKLDKLEDPEFLYFKKQLVGDEGSLVAEEYFDIADYYFTIDHDEDAEEICHIIMEQYKDSPQAKKAADLLKRIHKAKDEEPGEGNKSEENTPSQEKKEGK